MPFGISGAISAAMAGLDLERTEPLRITEAWFPIESAPMGEWIRVRFHVGRKSGKHVVLDTVNQARPDVWVSRFDGAHLDRPDEWRLLPEQEA